MAKKRRTELDMDRDFLAEEPEEPVAPPKEEKPPEPPKPAEPKRPKRKINKVKLLIVAGSGVAATTFTVALIWLAISFFSSIAERRQAAQPPPAPKEPATPAPFVAPVYALHPFFIPLREKGSSQSDLVKIQFALEMASPETQRDMDRNITLVRENVYFMLQNKAKSDFAGKERLDKLAVDVAIAVNRSLQSGGVTRVWITNILIN